MKEIPPQIIRQVFVILLILLMGTLIFRELLPYLTGVLGAITIYVLMRKWMVKLVKKKKWNPSFAAIPCPISSNHSYFSDWAGFILAALSIR